MFVPVSKRDYMYSWKINTRKKVFIFSFPLALLFSAFLFDVHPANAGLFSWIGDSVSDSFFWVINIILYSIFSLVSYPVSWAAMLFGLTVDPVATKTMFGMSSIYTLWQMIRDFFNLFFILTLLFIAFATIFQIESFNYKRTLGKLLLMALLVNFSFPIARFVIDTANVPMYFFMESMFKNKSEAKASNIAEVAFSASNLKGVVLPGISGYGDLEFNGSGDLTTKILVGIIFMFLFGVSLLVLAILFLIRSLMLVVLIIFSSVGFAGMVIPGFRKYATMWWDNLLKYAFFGPAAMLMILISVRFMQEFNSGVGSNASIQGVGGNVAGTPGEGGYLASMVAVMAPIIFIWISITVGQTMGIAGAQAVTSRAQQFSKWAGKRSAVGSWRTSVAGLRNLATKKDKDGNVVARDWAKRLKLDRGLEKTGAMTLARRSFAGAAQREEERKQLGFRKSRRALLEQMSEQDLLKELHGSRTGLSKLAGKIPGKAYGLDEDVAHAVVKSGLHRKLKADDENKAGILGADGKPAKNAEILQMLYQALEGAGDKDNLKSLETERWDVMIGAIKRKTEEENKGQTKEEIQKKVDMKVKEKLDKLIADGEHKKLSNVEVMNEGFVSDLESALGLDKAVEKIAEMPSNMLKRAEEVATKKLATTGNGWGQSKTWRKLGASVSGDAHKFFTDVSTDAKGDTVFGSTVSTALVEEARLYADKQKPVRIEKMSADAVREFSKHGSVGFLQNIGEAKISAEHRRAAYDEYDKRRGSDSEVDSELTNNPKWKSFSKAAKKASGGGPAPSWQTPL